MAQLKKQLFPNYTVTSEIHNNYLNSQKVTSLYIELLAMKFKSISLASFQTDLENINEFQLIDHKGRPIRYHIAVV